MAVTGTAWAETVPAFPVLGDVVNGYEAVHFYNRDRDMTTGYLAADGTYTRATPTSAFSPAGLTAFPDASLLARSGPGGGTESSWGIFAVRIIEAGATFAPGTPVADIFKKLSGDITYEWTDTNSMTNNTALVGVFYDGWDSSVTIAGTTLIVQTKQTKFELWAVDKATVNTSGASQGPAFVPANRTAQNRYTGWVNGGGTLLLSGLSTYERFVGTQTGGGPFVFDGQTVAYIDITAAGVPGIGPGVWNTALANNNYFTDPDGGTTADMKLTFDIDPGLDGWNVNSHDDGGTLAMVPEPLTMLGFVFSGLFAGGYLRRRNRNR